MKFNRKGKTIFAIALTACMAGMAFSALPLFSAHADGENGLQSQKNCHCDNYGYNAQGPCTTFTFTATKDTKWEDLTEAEKEIQCTGWVFDGWYTKELEYSYWGEQDDVFACYDNGVLFPKQDWKRALEFAEAYKDSTAVSESEMEKETNYFKDLFGRWLTRFKEDNEEVLKKSKESDEDILKATKEEIEQSKVTQENFDEKVKKGEESVTLYARMKAQTVQVKFLSKKPEAQKAKEDPNRPGIHYGDVSQYIRIYRQYGAPLGEIFKDIGDRQFGRTLTGWRKDGEDNELPKEDGTWIATTSALVNYWWCPQPLKEGFVESKPDGDDYGLKYQWTVDLYAIYADEDTSEQAEQEKAKKEEELQASQRKDTLKSAANDATEAEHQCGNGTLVFKEATCQSTGIKAHFECSCGRDYWDQGCTNPVEKEEDLVAPTHHNMVKIQGKKATCTEAGKADRWFCNTCHKSFSDEKGENELTDFTVQALGHEYVKQADGTKVCTRCGDVDDSEKNAVQEEVKPQEQPKAQEQPKVEEEKKEEAPKAETKQETKKEEVKEEVQQETQPETKQESTEPKAPVVPEKDEEEEKEEAVVAREQQTRPRSKKSPRA